MEFTYTHAHTHTHTHAHTHTHTHTHLPLHAACFNYLEELCSRLQESRSQLEQAWNEKGTKLDRTLQLRLFESEAEKIRGWMEREVGQLAQDHTDIGDSPSTAQLRRTAFGDYKARLKVRVCGLMKRGCGLMMRWLP